uniref:Uncharacterized protein n=1 Tax=Xiphophorus couchianus TaxID=32473 RepID=A0A3B5MJC5_9TELE
MTKSPSESEFKYIINPIKPSRFWIRGDPPPQRSAQGCERATRKRETGSWRRDGGRHAGRNAADGMVIVSLKDISSSFPLMIHRNFRDTAEMDVAVGDAAGTQTGP